MKFQEIHFYPETDTHKGIFPIQWLKTGKFISNLRYGIVMGHDLNLEKCMRV